MGTRIVTVNVSQTLSATPSGLQQMSAILSFGATPQKSGKPLLLTQKSDLDDLVRIPIKTITAAKGVDGIEAVFTLADDVILPRDVNEEFDITVEGCSPDIWNGSYTVQLYADNTLHCYLPEDTTLSGSPGSVGYFLLPSNENLFIAADTFFAQGSHVGVYLLELGYCRFQADKEIAALKEYIEEPLQRIYAYYVPRSWDGNENFISLSKLHTSNESMLYFFVLTDTPANTNQVSPYAGIKSVIATADPSYPVTNAAVAAMWNFVSASPSEVNKVPPMAFRFLQAVNVHTGKGNILKIMLNQNINYVDTGAEGGISNTILVNGVTSDGNDMTYWYSVDWVQINANMSLANAVINGSNNPINPLYYNQDGIDRLQLVAQGVFDTGGSYGLVNGAPVVSAIKFKTYIKNNPNDYAKGRYAGLSATYTPMRGFTEIVFNINVTMQLS